MLKALKKQEKKAASSVQDAAISMVGVIAMLIEKEGNNPQEIKQIEVHFVSLRDQIEAATKNVMGFMDKINSHLGNGIKQCHGKFTTRQRLDEYQRRQSLDRISYRN